MKSAILAIFFPFAAVAAALTPDTIKDDIPGTATISEIVTAGGSARPADVHRIVDGSFNGGTQEVNRVTGAFDGVAGRVGSLEGRTNAWNRAGSDATNYVDAATNAIRRVDGTARTLPKYLHAADFADSYTNEAAAYYASRGSGEVGGCSAVRDGGFLSRNFDFPFDDRAEFVVHMSSGPARFASVGVAQVGTNITEAMVTSGKPLPPRFLKALPGATVDGINEYGVVAEINVVDGDPQTSGWYTNETSEAIHPLAAVRWVLDHATNAQHAATYIAASIRFPQGWTQNYHYMIADETATYIVENGSAYSVPSASSPTGAGNPALTNFRLYGDPKDTTGEGQERYIALTNGANITSQWWTLTYTAAGYRASDLPGITGEALTQLFNYWASKPRESHRGETLTTSHQPPTTNTWWQTVHTSVYDISNRVLRVAVQETDDFYTFQVPASGTDEAKVREIASDVVAPVASQVSTLSSSVSSLQSSKLDKADVVAPSTEASASGKAADAKATGDALADKANRAESGHADKIAVLDEDGNPKASECDVLNIQAAQDIAENAFDEALYAGKKADAAQLIADQASDLAGIAIGMISATDPTFSNAVMSVATGISTNDWAVVASVADWASVLPGGVSGGAGTLGAVLAALAATALALKKKTSLLKSDGTAEDDFANDLLGKQVAKTALMIPLETVEAGTSTIIAEDGHAYAVTMTGTVTITMPTTTAGKAAIFQARFSAAAQQSVEFSTTDLVKFDGTDCGIVKAGKDALLSAMWNGSAWDLVWKNQA